MSIALSTCNSEVQNDGSRRNSREGFGFCRRKPDGTLQAKPFGVRFLRWHGLVPPSFRQRTTMRSENGGAMGSGDGGRSQEKGHIKNGGGVWKGPCYAIHTEFEGMSPDLFSDYHVPSPDLILLSAKAIGRSFLRSRKRVRANASIFARVLASPKRLLSSRRRLLACPRRLITSPSVS